MVARTTIGRFVKGQSGNPKGRPKNTSISEELRAAIKRVEAERGVSLFEHFVRRAYRSDAVLVAIMRKLVPDLKAMEALVAGVETMPDEVAEGIRAAMRERFA